MFNTDSGKKTAVIFLYGKAGVGKTSIAAMMTKILMNDKEAKLLTIDADPDLDLADTLGIQVNKTVYDIRKELLGTDKSIDETDKETIISNLESEIVHSMVEKDNLSFLAIGDLEEDEHFVKENDLLKDIISSLASNFDYVIIDGEVRIQQLNLRFKEKVTHLVLVSDATNEGINIIKKINEVSKDSIKYDKVGLILNRLKSKEEINIINRQKEVPLLTYIIDNDETEDFKILGKGILELPDGDFIYPIRIALSKLNV